MATSAERISVVETKVENLSEKIDDLKVDLKNLHDELSEDKQEITDTLNKMYSASCEQHAQLGKKLNELEKFKDKWVYMAIGASGILGWASGHLDDIARFLK